MTPINIASIPSSGTRHCQCRGRTCVAYVAPVAMFGVIAAVIVIVVKTAVPGVGAAVMVAGVVVV